MVIDVESRVQIPAEIVRIHFVIVYLKEVWIYLSFP